MQFIDLHRQYEVIGKKVESGLNRVLSHKKFIGGSEIRELEDRLADFAGTKHAICCANGTDALIISLMTIGAGDNDAVFVPSFTFFSTAESVSLAGATPVFVDCRRDTFNISAGSLKEAIENVKREGKLKPKAIVAVDLFGQPAEYDKIRKIADEYNLFVIEDGAQGFGGEIKGKKACSFGDISTTSFFPAKPLGCYGDGGAIFTDSDEFAEMIRSLHIHGQGEGKYDNIRIGMNSRLDTMQAVILDAKMDVFENELEMRNHVAQRYSEKLRDWLDVPVILDNYMSCWAQYTLKAGEGQNRDHIIRSLNEQNIPAAVYYPIPVHLSGAYKSADQRYAELTNTEYLCSRVFSIPMHAYLKDDEIDVICDTIKRITEDKNRSQNE